MLIVRYLMHIDSRDSSAVIAALDSMNSGLETKVFEVLYSKFKMDSTRVKWSEWKKILTRHLSSITWTDRPSNPVAHLGDQELHGLGHSRDEVVVLIGLSLHVGGRHVDRHAAEGNNHKTVTEPLVANLGIHLQIIYQYQKNYNRKEYHLALFAVAMISATGV